VLAALAVLSACGGGGGGGGAVALQRLLPVEARGRQALFHAGGEFRRANAPRHAPG